MKIVHDIYSEINPVYSACSLTIFTKTFILSQEQGPELPLAYISLPIALSGDLISTFEGTNKNTGLFEWLERNPSIRIGLNQRLNLSMDIVTNAIRFGCFSHMLVLENTGRLCLGRHPIQMNKVKKLNNTSHQTLIRAERLGHWFAAAGSTKTIFDMMELTA